MSNQAVEQDGRKLSYNTFASVTTQNTDQVDESQDNIWLPVSDRILEAGSDLKMRLIFVRC